MFTVAGPARESRAGRAPTGEWRRRGSVGADLIRESRRWFRLSRRSSAPSAWASMAFRRMVLSEAIPITTTAWVSQAQPILRGVMFTVAGPARESRAGRAPTGEWRRRGSVGADLIRESRRWFRLSRRSSAPSAWASMAFRRMVLSEAIPITTTAWVSQAQPILRGVMFTVAGPARESRAGRAPTGEWRRRGSVGADLIRESRRWFRLSRRSSAPTKSPRAFRAA